MGGDRGLLVDDAGGAFWRIRNSDAVRERGTSGSGGGGWRDRFCDGEGDGGEKLRMDANKTRSEANVEKRAVGESGRGCCPRTDVLL